MSIMDESANCTEESTVDGCWVVDVVGSWLVNVNNNFDVKQDYLDAPSLQPVLES